MLTKNQFIFAVIFGVLLSIYIHSSYKVEEMDKFIRSMKKLIPPLNYSSHKGQSGRIAVIGGSEEFTGAPYFAAISALKVGADLIHVFCSKSASPVIKSYSPELIVHPLLDESNGLIEMLKWLERMNAVVIGPGLGRLPETFDVVTKIISYLRENEIPVVIDADGLFLISKQPDIIKGYTKAVLTPNVVEFKRLTKVMNISSDSQNQATNLSKALNGVVIVQKGFEDQISDERSIVNVLEKGSPRRCGGQGDLLSGSLATFMFWAHKRFSFLSTYSICFQITKFI